VYIMYIMESQGIPGVLRSGSEGRNPEQRTASGYVFSSLKRSMMGRAEVKGMGFNCQRSYTCSSIGD